MSTEIHPFVEKMKDTIAQALRPKIIKDLYTADEVDDIENTGSLNAFLNQFIAVLSLMETDTQDSYLVFVRNQQDIQNKVVQINSLNKYKIIGIDQIKGK